MKFLIKSTPTTSGKTLLEYREVERGACEYYLMNGSTDNATMNRQSRDGEKMTRHGADTVEAQFSKQKKNYFGGECTCNKFVNCHDCRDAVRSNPYNPQFTQDELEDLFIIVDANIDRSGKTTKTMKLLNKIEELRQEGKHD